MRRLMENTVFSGLVTACRFATWPTRRSPLLVMATTEGVSREPSLFSSTVGSPASMTATTELVVPRSMPITFAITYRFLPFISHLRTAHSAAQSIRICPTSSSSFFKPFTGKHALMSTPVHAPEILHRLMSVGTILLIGKMLGEQIDLLAKLKHCASQLGEVSCHNNRLYHTLTSFRLIPPHTPSSTGEDVRYACFTWVNTHSRVGTSQCYPCASLTGDGARAT